ncbi:MAG: TetR/AcrR family transcriptional regulator [Bacteroidia bacterium]|nr:TetR/AcrR family transcriptional regulator [Bacteroidia bacterium]
MHRRANILNEVFPLYQRYGIKSVTMDDVAKHLGISKKTLYEFFIDKEDLVKQVLMHDYDIKLQSFLEIEKMNLNAIEELFEVYKMITEIFKDYNPSVEYDVKKYYPSLFIQLREVKRSRMLELSMKNMKKGQRDRFFRSELNVSLIARLHVFRVENLLGSDLFTMEELTSFRIFHDLFVYHLFGILSQHGREYMEENFTRFTTSLP